MTGNGFIQSTIWQINYYLTKKIPKCLKLNYKHMIGMDLILGVTCSEPYEWKDTTSVEWDFKHM